MAENIVTGLRQLIQDLVAPDLKSIQAKQDVLSRQLEVQHDALMKTVEAFRAECVRSLPHCAQTTSSKC